LENKKNRLNKAKAVFFVTTEFFISLIHHTANSVAHSKKPIFTIENGVSGILTGFFVFPQHIGSADKLITHHFIQHTLFCLKVIDKLDQQFILR
jgi:hypothetical protein